MLDTVLQIGRALRDPDNREKGLRHHRYVEPCPMGKEDDVLRLRVPVTEGFGIDLDGITPIRDELLFEKLFYLKYKMSDASSLAKYIFGDVYYTQKGGNSKKGPADYKGYYRRGDPDSGHKAYRKGSFDRGKDDAEEIIQREKALTDAKDGKDSLIAAFRAALDESVTSSVRVIDLIERLLKYEAGIRELLERGKHVDQELLLDESDIQFATAKRTFGEVESGRYSKRKFRSVLDDPEPGWRDVKDSLDAVKALADYADSNVFLHFDFAGRHWYEQESAMQATDQQFVSKFANAFAENGYKGAVLMKYLYKTMGSPESSLQIPNFSASNQHRLRLLSEEELMNLFYAIEMAKTPKFRPRFTDMKVIVLPRGENMSAEDVTRFMQGAQSLEEESEQEKEFKGGLRDGEEQPIDDLLDSIFRDTTDRIVEFDLVFSEADSRGQDADLVELSGVSRSFLERIRKRIGRIRREVEGEYQEKMGHELENLSIYRAFRGLLSGVGQDEPRYQRHLYRMLPKIYTETYYEDPLLLPALIEQTEAAVRSDKEAYFEFNRLDHYFRFLARIQNSQGDNLMRIVESPSYKMGRPLGVMARPLNWDIKSFEKNYVGNLRRRIATLDDLIEFKNEIEEMLVRHERAYRSEVQEAREELHALLASQDQNDRLDKNHCAFGFFRGYFKPSDENGKAS